MDPLFLRVPHALPGSILGFLAEYQLGHKIEKDRKVQYIYSLIEDLSTDTINLQKVIAGFNKREKNNKSDKAGIGKASDFSRRSFINKQGPFPARLTRSYARE